MTATCPVVGVKTRLQNGGRIGALATRAWREGEFDCRVHEPENGERDGHNDNWGLNQGGDGDGGNSHWSSTIADDQSLPQAGSDG
jgi:hypothetical protein